MGLYTGGVEHMLKKQLLKIKTALKNIVKDGIKGSNILNK